MGILSSIKLLSGKLHRVQVTETNKDYVGSITIDSELLDKVGIIPLEEVEIVNVSNGNRWSTYVLPGEPGGGMICPNGGGAFLCKQNDLLIIYSYIYSGRSDVYSSGHQAKVLVSDENNRCKDLFIQKLVPGEDGKLSFFEKIK